LGDHFDNFGSLGDLFPTSELKCRIRGCDNLVQVSGEQAMYNAARGQSGRPDKMCQSCYERFLQLEDREQPCSKPGCSGSWVWNRFQQLEALAYGNYDNPPKGLCEACRQEVREGSDVEQKCRMRGCKNTWVWSSRMQLQSGLDKPPKRLCEECFQTLKTLHDQELPCRIKSCQNSFVWNKYQQLEHLLSGKKLDAPPPRMCEPCFQKFRLLNNSVEPCKISGCSGTWVYNAYEQLERQLACKEGESPAKPSRMCNQCFDFFNNCKDIELNCKNRHCEHKWLWTRGMQLGYRLRNPEGRPPARMCKQCVEKLKSLSTLQEPCSQQGCNGSWNYEPEEQLLDQLAGKRPAAKACKTCQDFLASHESAEISCSQCGTVFLWSSHEQLLHSLGVFDKPQLCANCVGAKMRQITPKEAPKPAPEERFSIRIPQRGAWQNSAVIRDWPPHMNISAIRELEEASLRVLCFGDELTFCSAESEKGWPAMLKKRLQKRYEPEFGRLGLINVGMPGSNTALSIRRFERDVLPFEPHLLIFSFAFSDTFMLDRHERAQAAEALARLSEDFEQLLRQFEKLPPLCRLLCWLPNPIFPQKEQIIDADWRERGNLDLPLLEFYESLLRQMRQKCQSAGLNCLEGRTLFEIGGRQTALKWMQNWYLPNEIGQNSFAGWFENIIQRENLLQPREEN